MVKAFKSCPMCGCADADPMVLQERMFGTREQFDYLQCRTCGSLRISKPPEDLGKYYPTGYYSFQDRPLRSRRKALLSLARVLRGHGPSVVWKKLGLNGIRDVLPKQGGCILDIGSGSGFMLRQLCRLGYDCWGVDPYVKGDMLVDGVRILKRHLSDVDGAFDLVMSHHSLEHMPDPRQVFADVARLVTPTGAFILRVPVLPNNVWDVFGVDWPQLDAPRHLFTFTLDGLRHLASANGFSITKVDFDASPWSLVAARAYREGRSLRELTDEELKGTPQDAVVTAEANKTGTSDQVRLVLRRSNRQ